MSAIHERQWRLERERQIREKERKRREQEIKQMTSSYLQQYEQRLQALEQQGLAQFVNTQVSQIRNEINRIRLMNAYDGRNLSFEIRNQIQSLWSEAIEARRIEEEHQQFLAQEAQREAERLQEQKEQAWQQATNWENKLARNLAFKTLSFLKKKVKDENWDIIDSTMKTISDKIPPGVILMYGAPTAPPGWLECDGSAVSRTTYSALFSVIGTTYGSGDGTTTFNLPDLRGEFIRGWDHGRGVDKNRIFGSTQEDEIKSHNHPLRTATHWGAGGTGSAPSLATDVTEYGESTNVIKNTGGTETRPRNVALIYIIKT